MSFSPALTARIESGEELLHNWAFYVEAVRKDNQNPEPQAIWDGIISRSINCDGQQRDYSGGFGVLKPDVITRQKGFLVQTQSIIFSAVTAEEESKLRGFEIEKKKCDLYLVIRDPLSGAVLGTQRFFKGLVNSLEMETGGSGRAKVMTVSMESSMRFLNNSLGLHQSHQQQLRLSGDRGMEYSSVTASNDKWRNK